MVIPWWKRVRCLKSSLIEKTLGEAYIESVESNHQSTAVGHVAPLALGSFLRWP